MEVLISARDARLLAGDKSVDPDEPQTKLRGGITGAETTADADDRGRRRRIGSLEVHASPGHTPGHLAFFDPRDRALYARRRVLDVRRRRHRRQVGALPAPGDGDVAQADRARVRAQPARARSRAARHRPRQGRRATPARRWTARSRAEPRVPRRGLDREQVVDAAVAIADADGLEAVTLARVAAELGVRSPSLYNHVDGHAGLLRGGRGALDRASWRRRCAAPRPGASGDDAIMAVAQAHRAYVARAPGALRRDRGRPGVREPGAPRRGRGRRRRRRDRARRRRDGGRRRHPRGARAPQRGPRVRHARGDAAGSRCASTPTRRSAGWSRRSRRGIRDRG